MGDTGREERNYLQLILQAFWSEDPGIQGLVMSCKDSCLQGNDVYLFSVCTNEENNKYLQLISPSQKFSFFFPNHPQCSA